MADTAVVCGALGVIPLAAVVIAVGVAAETAGVMTEGLLLGYGFFAAVPGLGFTVAALALGGEARRQCRKESARVRRNAVAGITLGMIGLGIFFALVMTVLLTDWPAGPT